MKILLLLSLLLFGYYPNCAIAESPSAAKELVKKAINHWRGEYSMTESDMTIHRSGYEKSLTLKAWTKGRELSLVKFIKPAKEANNSTLMKGNDVWTFNPRTNRTIRIPPSMKAQSWMGSDFSYQDLAKDDDIIDFYQHQESRQFELDGQKVRTIIATPLDSAPIVWGKEELDIREDLIILEHRYFDQDGKLIKTLKASEIGMLGGRIYPIKAKMLNEESKEWTEIVHRSADFESEIPDKMFNSLNLETNQNE